MITSYKGKYLARQIDRRMWDTSREDTGTLTAFKHKLKGAKHRLRT